MFKFGFAALLGLALLSGCHSKNMDCCSSAPEKMMSMENVDVCSHCAGTQKLTADGKCSSCGMKVADACPKCAGTQVVLPNGTCSGCGMACEKKG